MGLGLAGTERPIKGNPGVGHSGRPSGQRRRLLSRVIVAATAAVLCTLGLRHRRPGRQGGGRADGDQH